ncbi:hypothetical protein G7054_g10744 [Neopestalotiopsis clavispora]|nr:hypothetical protein G7054_g10744 [Neopestalotiopsis clavispora]
MVAFGKSATVSTIGLVAMVQFCPAPFLAAIPAATAAGINTAAAVIGAAGGVAGAVTGAISAANGRRGMFPRQEQNELAWQLCREQLTGATITFDGPSPGNIIVSGIPPACMTLATVITGTVNAGNPVPQGTDSILFQNLTDDELRAMQSALDARV